MVIKYTIAILSCLGFASCGDMPADKSELALQETVANLTPKMSAFYLECLKASGIPGQEWRDEYTTKYFGPEYMFHIWTPDIEGDYGQLSLDVQYKNLHVPGSPAPRKFIERKLKPGDTAVFSSNNFSLRKSPRTGNSVKSKIEYCMKSYPTIDLSGLNSPISDLLDNATETK